MPTVSNELANCNAPEHFRTTSTSSASVASHDANGEKRLCGGAYLRKAPLNDAAGSTAVPFEMGTDACAYAGSAAISSQTSPAAAIERVRTRLEYYLYVGRRD